MSLKWTITARKGKVDDYSKFSNDDFKISNGKIPGKTEFLNVPEIRNSERAMSQTSFKDPRNIENITDWKKIIKKYYALKR